MSHELAVENKDSERLRKEAMMIFGGAALVVVGAGIILSRPGVRKYLHNKGLGDMLGGALPDLERYMKIRAM